MQSTPSINIEAIFFQIYTLITGSDIDGATFSERLFALWSYVHVISFILSFFLIIGIVYSFVRIWQIQKMENVRYSFLQPVSKQGVHVETKRWQDITTRVESDNPADWSVAILEADSLLDELVTQMGYRGDGLGEKLKGVEKSDFLTIEDAWEAHKIRNLIAHKGSDFILTQRETRRVIELFRGVFEEFHYI